MNNPQQLRKESRRLVRELGMLATDCCDVNLTPVQAHSLIEIEQRPLTVKQLACELKVDKSNASRTISKLCDAGLVSMQKNTTDARSQTATVTELGIGLLDKLNQSLNKQYASILSQMLPSEREQLSNSLSRFSKSIIQEKQQREFIIRPLAPSDNLAIANVIRDVSAEFGLSACKGYGVSDPNLEVFSEVYSGDSQQYWVIEYNGKIVGGAGAQILAGEPEVCELNKMYFLPIARGIGLSRLLAIKIIEFAQQQGYKKLYLETTSSLKEALYLYQSLGFKRLAKPLGQTGHGDCEIPMELELT
jgi:putative acetyltransferase